MLHSSLHSVTSSLCLGTVSRPLGKGVNRRHFFRRDVLICDLWLRHVVATRVSLRHCIVVRFRQSTIVCLPRRLSELMYRLEFCMHFGPNSPDERQSVGQRVVRGPLHLHWLDLVIGAAAASIGLGARRNWNRLVRSVTNDDGSINQPVIRSGSVYRHGLVYVHSGMILETLFGNSLTDVWPGPVMFVTSMAMGSGIHST